MKQKPFFLSEFWTVAAAVLCFLIVLGPRPDAAAEEADPEMLLIWSESDGQRNEVYASKYASEEWTDPAQLTDNSYENMHPSIDIDSDGVMWAVWTAMEGTSYEIWYSTASGDTWNDPEEIPSDLASNIKPSIAVDGDNVPWVVWSGNDNDDDDIYYTKFVNGSWTEPARVHEENEVPDILPYLDTDDAGLPVVTWSTFSEDGYVWVQSIWNGSEWEAAVQVDDDSEAEDETEIVIPEFVNDTRQVFLRVLELPDEETDDSSTIQ